MPRDGEAVYFGPLCAADKADGLFAALMEEIDWQHDRVKLYGREIVTKREVAWHGDAAFSIYLFAQHKNGIALDTDIAKHKANG